LTIWSNAGGIKSANWILRDRPHPGHREAYCRAHDQALRERRVEDPRRPELFLQTLRHPEDTAGPADVLA